MTRLHPTVCSSSFEGSLANRSLFPLTNQDAQG